MDIQKTYRNEDIKKLLNQRDPILMVDAFEEVSENVGSGEKFIDSENFFCVDGRFTEPGLIEHIAQSASAFVSYRAISYQGQKEAPVGYIGEVKKFVLSGALPQVGKTVKTEITIQSEVMNITSFSAKSCVDGEVIATCQMKLSV